MTRPSSVEAREAREPKVKGPRVAPSPMTVPSPITVPSSAALPSVVFGGASAGHVYVRVKREALGRESRMAGASAEGVDER